MAHPIDELQKLATEWNIDLFSEEFSVKIDEKNVYPINRDKFYYPKIKDLPKIDFTKVDKEADCIYMCGNSLGLQPKMAKVLVDKEFDKWAKIGVHGHLEGDLPWATCEDVIRPSMAKVVGARTEEVNLMNFLTVNLHLMMISFYQPTKTRFKILLEDKAFPSDHVNLFENYYF